jgi:hypothetical protein
VSITRGVRWFIVVAVLRSVFAASSHGANTDPPADPSANRPELRDELLPDLHRGGGRSSGPEIIDQAVTRDELVRVEKQDREERPLLRRVQGNHPKLRPKPRTSRRGKGQPCST